MKYFAKKHKYSKKIFEIEHGHYWIIFTNSPYYVGKGFNFHGAVYGQHNALGKLNP